MEGHLDLFGVNNADLDKVIAGACRRGASYSDIYLEDFSSSYFILRDSAVAQCGSGRLYGAGIRALCGEKTGYASCESTALPDLLKAADTAGTIADGAGDASVRIQPTAKSGNRDFYPVKTAWESVPNEEYTSALYALEAALKSKDSRILKVIAELRYSVEKVTMYNSFGELTSDTRPTGRMSATIIFGDGRGGTLSLSCGRSWKCGFEMIGPGLVEELVGKLTGGIDNATAARRPRGGRMNVVLGAGASGILLHEAMGHSFEADFNRKGQSIFSDKMGRQVCPKGINIVDDATVPGNRGSLNVDDEGVPGQKTYMVTDGILTSYLHDRISAAHYGVAPTGNGRRESFEYNPIPRMRLTYMENGDAKLEDMIALAKNGIYVDEFSNGQVKIGEGDFTFFVKSGFLIENGRLTMPIKDVNVIGNGPEALRDIRAVGNDLKIDNGCWTCGKEQSVSVGCGMPSVFIEGLTVGGRQD